MDTYRSSVGVEVKHKVQVAATDFDDSDDDIGSSSSNK
jgi:hypothetical protein